MYLREENIEVIVRGVNWEVLGFGEASLAVVCLDLTDLGDLGVGVGVVVEGGEGGGEVDWDWDRVEERVEG